MSPLKREFEYFLEICNHKNLSRSAENLGLQQAALSRSLAKLEAMLGHKLFLRKGRGVETTDEGRRLQRALLALDSSWQKNYVEEDQSDQIRGIISISAHEVNARDLLVPSLTKLNEEHPQLKVNLNLCSSLHAVQRVIEGVCDFALAVNPSRYSDLVIKSLKHDKVYAWSQSSKPDPVLYYNPEMLTVPRLLNRHQHYKQIPLSSYELILDSLGSSHSVGFLPTAIAKRNKRLRPVSKAVFEANICLLFRSDRPQTLAFQAVKNELLGLSRSR